MNFEIDVPEAPGIYLVSLLTETPMPVTRDKRYVDSCGRVNKSNLKIGKAVNLAQRRKNYWKDFDAHNVQFEPLAIMQEIVQAESQIKAALQGYRTRSPKGGLMEWLEGISRNEVIKIVFNALDSSGCEYKKLTR